jgi:hypothetical protein
MRIAAAQSARLEVDDAGEVGFFFVGAHEGCGESSRR